MSTKQEKHNVANPSASTYTVLPQFEQSITCCKERERKKSQQSLKKGRKWNIFIYAAYKKKKPLVCCFSLDNNKQEDQGYIKITS